jgi:arylsulfotransferase ASST
VKQQINSIDLTADGNFLVSARNTWGVYKIDPRTSEVLWRLGGKRSSFEMGKGTVFAWQHDARHHGNGLIKVFDDGGQPFVEPQARALVIRLDGNSDRRSSPATTHTSRAGSGAGSWATRSSSGTGT